MERLGWGSAKPPQEGTRDWYLLRALATGLSSLRALGAQGLENDHVGAEREYKRILGENKTLLEQVRG